MFKLHQTDCSSQSTDDGDGSSLQIPQSSYTELSLPLFDIQHWRVPAEQELTNASLISFHQSSKDYIKTKMSGHLFYKE